MVGRFNPDIVHKTPSFFNWYTIYHKYPSLFRRTVLSKCLAPPLPLLPPFPSSISSSLSPSPSCLSPSPSCPSTPFEVIDYPIDMTTQHSNIGDGFFNFFYR